MAYWWCLTHGTVEDVSIQGRIGQVVGPIDLRLFLAQWHVGFAVTEALGIFALLIAFLLLFT